jgi:hypothetical protein
MKYKEPSLLRKLVDIYYEQAKRRRALRILTKQEWSFDFLAMMLIKAGQKAGQGLSLIIENGNQRITLSYNEALRHDLSGIDGSEDIFNQLDNQAAVESFIANHSTR